MSMRVLFLIVKGNAKRKGKTMKVANNFWINTEEDFFELKSIFDNGSRLASPLEFSHAINDDGNKFYCFRPTDERIDGAFYIAPSRVCDVFTMLDATVTYHHEYADITFDGRSMIFNHSKTIKFELDERFCYQFSETSYQSRNAYEVLEMLASGFFGRMAVRGMIEAGYFE